MRTSEHRAAGRWRLCLLSAALLVAHGAAPQAQQAAADPAALQQALSRAQGLLRQLAEQRTRLEADNAAAQVKIAGLERDLAREKHARDELATDLELAARKSESLDKKLAGSGERLAQTEQRLRDTVAKCRELAAEHRATLAAKGELETQLTATRADLTAARKRNHELYGINAEILEHFKSKTSWTSFLQSEPALGLKQVEIENLEQDLRHRNEDQRLAPPSQAPQSE